MENAEVSLKRKVLEQLMNHMDEKDRADMKKDHEMVMEHTRVHTNSDNLMGEEDKVPEVENKPEPDEDDSSSEPQFINPLDMYAKRKYKK